MTISTHPRGSGRRLIVVTVSLAVLLAVSPAVARHATVTYAYQGWVPQGCSYVPSASDDFNQLLQICQCADGSENCDKLSQDSVVFKE